VHFYSKFWRKSRSNRSSRDEFLPERGAAPPRATGLPRRARTPEHHGNPRCRTPCPDMCTRRALPAPARAAPPPYMLLPSVASPSVPPCSKAKTFAYKTPKPPPHARTPWPRASAVRHRAISAAAAEPRPPLVPVVVQTSR
jgi:hypothetical protein